MNRFEHFFCALLLTTLLLWTCSLGVSAQQIALKTNALYWFTSTPNFAVEVGINPHVSLQLAVGYNAWKFAGKHSLKHTSFIPEARYWLSRPMERHYVGVYGQYSAFNLRNAPLWAQNDLSYRGRLYGGGGLLRLPVGIGQAFRSRGVGRVGLPLYRLQPVPIHRLLRRAPLRSPP